MAPPPRVSTRTATGDDLEHLKQVLYMAVGWNPDRILPPFELVIGHEELARYYRKWGRRGDLGVIAEVDGGFVGAAFCRLFTEDDHGHRYVNERTPELAIAVVDEYRGMGIGRLLMEELAERARGDGIGALSLSVDSRNPASRLYERLGYRTVSHDEDGGVRMVLNLDQGP